MLCVLAKQEKSSNTSILTKFSGDIWNKTELMISGYEERVNNDSEAQCQENTAREVPVMNTRTRMSFVFLCPQLHSNFNQRQRRATHAPFPFIKAKQLLRNVWLTLHPITWERFFSLDVNSSRPLGLPLLPPVINYHAPQPNTDAIYSAYS